jgi:two-component system LytT family sensor kinase
MSAKNVCITLLVLSITVLCVKLCIMSVKSPHALAVQPDTLDQLRFEGTYRVDGEDPERIEGGSIPLDYRKHHTVVLDGHFTSAVPAGMRMMIRLKFLTVRFAVENSDGTESVFFAYGDGDTRPAFRRTGGFLYQQFNSPGLTPETPVRITLVNTKTLDTKSSFDGFLSGMYAGSVHELFRKEIRRYWAYPFFAVLFVPAGLWMLFMILLTSLKNLWEAKGLIVLSLVIIFGGIWDGFIYSLFTLIVPYPALADVIAYTCYYVLGALIPLFFAEWFATRLRYAAYGCFWFAGAAAVIVLILQAAGKVDLFGKLTVIYIYYYFIMFITMSVFSLLEVFVFRNRQIFPLLISSVIFVATFAVSGIISFFHPFSNLYFLRLLGSFGFAASQVFFIFRQINREYTERMRMEKMKSDMEENRRKIMLSQIQPHFLYNALSAIKELALEDDKKKTGQAIDNFSFFLRGNIDSLSAPGLIPFEKELEHTKQYLALEQLRFGSRLNVVYDIRTVSFSLPPLTLQPIVENAVRYGILQKDEGGTVTISASRSSGFITVSVSDNGTGFDPEAEKNDGRTHIGIRNVRERISLQCGGSLSITSVIGSGTDAVITIPAEKEEEEQ